MDGHGSKVFLPLFLFGQCTLSYNTRKKVHFFREINFTKIIFSWNWLPSPLCNDYYLDIVSKKYLFSLFQRSNKRKVTGRNQALLSSAISSTREETQKSTKWDPVLFALKAAKNFFHRPFYGGGPACIQIQNP